MQKVTQATIAKMHGVSRQTVGCALGLYTNSNIKLSAGMRAQIIQTAKELGYRPNRLAQIISGRKSGAIGVMNFGGIAQMSSQHAFHVAKAIQEAGYQLMLYDVTWYQEGGIETVMSALLDNRVEGIILISPTEWMPPKILEEIRRFKIPMVAVGGIYLEGIPRVESDYEEGMFRLVKGLLDAEYRDFLYLGNWSSPNHDETHSSPHFKRLRGFRRAIEERGGSVHDVPGKNDPKGIRGEIFHTAKATDWTDPYQVGEYGMQQILARRVIPEIVLCANDDWAAGALKACGQAGVDVPGSIAITGNDGTIISGYGFVPITTIIQPLKAIAEKAIELLTVQIKNEDRRADTRTLKLPGEIAWRDSTRAPANKAE